MKLERLYEGACPHCGDPLERMEDCGWCARCGVGHSINPDTYTLHIKPRIPGSLVKSWTMTTTEDEPR